MWLVQLCALFVVTQAAKSTSDHIGYFWHITDIHFDPHFSPHGDTRKGCSRSEYEGSSRASRRPSGRYGDYSCDAPWDLIESAARTMISRQGDNVEFVLWTGDALSNFGKKHESSQLQHLENLTELLQKTFSSQFVFPALGHDDPLSRKELGKMWSRWLPTDSMNTFEKGGYYMIERKAHKLQIIILNTNLMKEDDDDPDAMRQWEWLNTVLNKTMHHKQTVYIVGHIPPGSDERQRGAVHPTHIHYSDYHNRIYLTLVKRYSEIIVGQFFGHLHSDSFRVVYNDYGIPVSWAMLAPALTPRRTSDGPNNPGLRLYKFNKHTGQILDYTQFYLDLTAANSNTKNEAEWAVEYTFSHYYRINNITAQSLHNLAEKMTHSVPPGDTNEIFNRYYKANSVRMYTNNYGSCDANCIHSHYCAITRIDFEEYEHCLKTAASALASSSLSIVLSPNVVLLLLLSFVNCIFTTIVEATPYKM